MNFNLKKLTLFYLLATLLINFSFAQQELSNQLIWYSPTFYPKFLQGGESMNDGEHYTRIDKIKNKVGIYKFKYSDNSLAGEIVDFSQINQLIKLDEEIYFSDYEFSSDENKILLIANKESIYRHSFRADYYIYDIRDNKVYQLDINNKKKISLGKFSPDGTKFSYVLDNNIFIYDFKSSTQITNDGEWNKIINGAVDWVYEEEFGFHEGYTWAPNGKYIAYFKFNESEVKMWDMKMYGKLYPDHYTFKYPKAGEKNSEVSIKIYDTESKITSNCNLGENKDIYVPRILWMPDNRLMVQKLNRHQNHLEFFKYAFDTRRTELIGELVYEEKNESYVEITDNVTVISENRFVLTSEKDGYNHIYIKNKNEVKQVTKGEWDVIDVKGVDLNEETIYYTSVEEGSIYKTLYSIKFNGSKKTKLSKKLGYNDAQFSKGYKYYINTFSKANTPPVISLHDKKGKLVQELISNKSLKEVYETYKAHDKEFIQIPNENSQMLNAWMIKPANFDSTKKYPVFMTLYNGPGRNMVTDEWGYSTSMWHNMLAQKGYIVLCVDGRGTMYRGEEFKKCTYMQLGKLETEDQISAARYVSTWNFVDSQRIGIQGWSYGGYMSSLCITKGADVFKMAIAVAPVTNWRYYDSIYTERFMRTPQENESGYDDNSPINHVDKLKGKYLLIHGSGDDNVHVQNSMEMVTALVNANKQFDLFIYPNKNHGIYGGTTRMHLFNKMTDFILNNL